MSDVSRGLTDSAAVGLLIARADPNELLRALMRQNFIEECHARFGIPLFAHRFRQSVIEECSGSLHR